MLVRRWVQLAIVLLGTTLLAYTALYAAWEFSGFSRVLQVEFLPFEFAPVNGVWIIEDVTPAGFGTGKSPTAGDTLVAVVDGAERRTPDETRRWFDHPRRVVVEYRDEGQLHQATATTQPPDRDFLLNVMVMEVIRLLGILALVVVGMWAFLTRPGSAGVHALTLFSLALAALLLRSVSPLANTGLASFSIPFDARVRSLLLYLLFFFPAFWWRLTLLFPSPHRWLQRHPVWANVAVFGPPALFVANQALLADPLFPLAVMLVMALQVGCGFAFLGYRFSQASTSLEKRQFRLVVLGTSTGLGALLLVLVVGDVSGLLHRLPELWRALALSIMYLCLLAIPISFAHAFRRYRLLEVEGKVRRNLRYLLVTTLLLLIFVATENGIVALAQGWLGIDSNLPTTVLALAFALAFAPAHRWVGRVTEHRFYPERRKLRRLLQEFLATTAALPNLGAFWRRLDELFHEGLGTRDVLACVRASEDKAWQDAAGRFLPVAPDGGLVRMLTSETRALMVDEALAAEPPFLTPEEAAWLEDEPYAMLLALRRGEELRGALLLTWPPDRERLAPDDVKLLTSLADQIALQYENLCLREEREC